MFHHLLVRSGAGLPLAALVVWGLFAFMTAIIRSEFSPPAEMEPRELSAFTMPPEQKSSTPPERETPDVIYAAPPPLLPALAVGETRIGLAPVTFGPAVPSTIDAGVLKALDVMPVAIANRLAIPLAPPTPVYPQKLAQRGIEGKCDVHFDIDERGRPFNVEAACSHDGFAREAVRAIRKVQFAPEIVDGRPRIRQNVVYPIEFLLGEE